MQSSGPAFPAAERCRYVDVPARSVMSPKTVLLSLLIVAAATTNACAEEHRTDNSLKTVEEYTKVVGVVIAGLGFILGLPLSILHFRKTKSEIRKLELEAQALQLATRNGAQASPETRILIQDSPNANIKVMADPRLRAPMVLLLDFIVAWIILTIAAYPIRFFLSGILSSALLLIIALILLIPILREAKRLRSALEPNRQRDVPDAT